MFQQFATLYRQFTHVSLMDQIDTFVLCFCNDVIRLLLGLAGVSLYQARQDDAIALHNDHVAHSYIGNEGTQIYSWVGAGRCDDPAVNQIALAICIAPN